MTENKSKFCLQKGIEMQNNTVLKELIRLNSGISNIRYAENNMWFSENPKYADFVADLKENIRNNDVRGSILIATDSEIIWASGSRSVDVNGDTVTPHSTYEIGSPRCLRQLWYSN